MIDLRLVESSDTEPWIWRNHGYEGATRGHMQILDGALAPITLVLFKG